MTPPHPAPPEGKVPLPEPEIPIEGEDDPADTELIYLHRRLRAKFGSFLRYARKQGACVPTEVLLGSRTLPSPDVGSALRGVVCPYPLSLGFWSRFRRSLPGHPSDEQGPERLKAAVYHSSFQTIRRAIIPGGKRALKCGSC